jgi:hypothetical protein
VIKLILPLNTDKSIITSLLATEKAEKSLLPLLQSFFLWFGHLFRWSLFLGESFLNNFLVIGHEFAYIIVVVSFFGKSIHEQLVIYFTL